MPFVEPFYSPEPETDRPLRLEAQTTMNYDLSKGSAIKIVGLPGFPRV